LAAGRPKSQAPESQAAPQAPGAQQSQSYFMAAQPGAYQMLADHVYQDAGYDVERAVASFLSATPQQVEQFIASQPPQVAETIRDVGFPSVAREVDQKVLDAMAEPWAQQRPTATPGIRQQPAQTQPIAAPENAVVAGAPPRDSRPLILIVAPGAMQRIRSA
jgi:hypothetical protein